VLLKDLPAASLLLFPFYTIWRYSIQIYGLFSGRGSVARLAEQSGTLQMMAVVLKAYAGVLTMLPRMVRKRKEIWDRRRIGLKAYKSLLKRHRISAKELMLRD
jgi:hypothetical protein